MLSGIYSHIIMGTLNLHIPSELHTHKSKDVEPLLQSVILNTDITNFTAVTYATKYLSFYNVTHSNSRLEAQKT